MSLSGLYGNVGNVIVSANNLTTLYNATGGNVVTANVPDKDFTTLYTNQVQIEPTRAYGNSNVEAFLNAGFDAGGNVVQNINADGNIHANGNLTISGITNLGNVGNVHIDGGLLNYVLQTDGAGNLNWVAQAGAEGNAIPYTHFDVTTTGNNQQFTSTNLGSFTSVNDMAVFKNGINIEPSLYSKPSQNVLQINILLNTGDTIDVLPSATGGGGSNPGGNLTEVQYNGGAVLSGNASFTFDQPNSTMHVGNIVTGHITATNVSTSNIAATGNVTLGDVGNVHIAGGTNGQVLITDGLGTLYWGSNPVSSINANINDVHISGGTNGQVLKTDGSNNLSWTSYIANSNYANNAGNANYANSANTANTATIATSATTAGSAVTAATVTASAQPNITSFGTLTGLNVGGSIFCADITAGNVTANFVSGNGYQLYSINGANISGYVANTVHANVADVANSVAGANVTGAVAYATTANSVAGANVSGAVAYATTANSVAGANVSGQVAYAAVANSVAGSNVTGAVSLATYASIANSVAGANVTGQVNYAAIANSVAGANVSGAVSYATVANSVAGANVTGAVAFATTANSVAGANVSGAVNLATYATTANSVAGANVSGAVAFATTANSVAGANVSGQVANALVAGTVYTNAQPNITSVGTLTSLTVGGMTTIQEAKEKFVPNATGATGTVNFDILTSAIILQTANASANFTINIRGNSTTTFNNSVSANESVSLTYVNKNGATAYYANSFQIDSVNVTPVWSGNAPAAGTTNGYDVYNFNILKTAANTYVVFGLAGGYQ